MIYTINNYFSKLAVKFKEIQDIFVDSIFKLRTRDRIDVSALEDPIVIKAILARMKKDKGFGNPKVYIENVRVRTRKFSFQDRKKIKLIAAQLMTKEGHTKISKNTLLKAVSLVREHLKLHKKSLRPIGPQEAAASFKLQTSAGFYWFTKKGKVLEDIVNSTQYFLSNFDPRLLGSFPVYIAYRVQQRPSDVKLRLIYVYSAIITLLEQMFLTPLTEYLCSIKTPYVISNVGSDLVLRYNYWNTKKYKVSLDWSSFDWRANPVLIKYSFLILKDAFSLTSLESMVFDFLAHYFLNTPFISNIPEDDEFRVLFKKRGIPSGSSFTNLVGTMVNMLAVYCYCIDSNISIDPMNVAFLGDDVIFATNHQFSIEHFASYSLEMFDMEVSTEKSKIFGMNEPVYFLGALFDNNGRYCNKELLQYQMSSTTSDLFIKCKTSKDHIVRLWNKLCSICFKYSDGHLIFDKIWPEIEDYLGVSYYSSEYIEVFSRATVPGSTDPEVGSVKNFKLMRELGWLIQ